MGRAGCRFGVALAALLWGASGAALAQEPAEDAYDAVVNEAIELVKQEWEKLYESGAAGEETTGYLEIKNTRIVYLKDDIGADEEEEPAGDKSAAEAETESEAAAPAETDNDDTAETGFRSAILDTVKAAVAEQIEGADCVVEFILLSDMGGSAPYYVELGMYQSVVVYEDGTMEVRMTSPVEYVAEEYRKRAYRWGCDLTWLVESVEDLGSRYNQSFILLSSDTDSESSSSAP